MPQVLSPMEAVFQACESRMQQFRADLNRREEALAEAYRCQVESRIQGLKKEQKRAQNKLAQIPAFRFSQKRSAWAEVERLEKCIAEYAAPTALQQARLEYRRKIDKAIARYRTKLDTYLTRRFPGEALHQQAKLEFEGWYIGSNSQLKDLIYAALQEKPGQTGEELRRSIPQLAERSLGRMEYVLSELEKQGQVRTVSLRDGRGYKVCGIRVPKAPKLPQMEADYEDPEFAAQPIPEPPAVEEVL